MTILLKTLEMLLSRHLKAPHLCFFCIGLLSGVAPVAHAADTTLAPLPGLVRSHLLVNEDAPFGTVLRPNFIIQTDSLPATSGAHMAGVTILKPHLIVTVTPDRTSLSPGDRLTYTLRGRVEGGNLALGRVDFSLQGLPLSLYMPGTSQENLVGFGEQDYGYVFDDLESGQEFTRTVVFTINNVATINTSFRLPVVIISRPPDAEANAISITNEVPLVTVGGKTSLVIVAAAPKFVYQGQTLTYNVTVSNTGNSAAPNVRVFADIPPGTTYVSGSARFQLRQGTISGQNGDVVFTLSQPLPPGETALMRYSVRVSDKFRGSFGNSILNRSVRAVADNILTVPSAQVQTGIGVGRALGLALQDFITGAGGVIGNYFKGIGDDSFFSNPFGGGTSKPGALPDSNPPAEVRRLINPNGISLGVGGAPIITVGGASIIALGGVNAISNGRGNVIALGDANVISGNGSTTVTVGDGNTVQGPAIIAVGGANIIAVGGANLRPVTAAQLVGLSGPNALTPAPGTGITALGGGNALSGNNIVALGGASIRALGSSNLTQQQRATIIALGGANIIANGGNN
jgi:uncharacterized repeat protein (TIGR01451 family)